jgi:hypothetical protein
MVLKKERNMSDHDVSEDTICANSRSVRRHHLERLKKNRATYGGFPQHDTGDDKAMTDRLIGIVANTPKACSCWKCSRPRKVWGERTVQELRQMQPALQEWSPSAE